MKVARQWMTNSFLKQLPLGSLFLCAVMSSLVSCNPTEITANGSGNNGIVSYDGTYANMAYIYRESPAIIAGPNYGPQVDIGMFIDTRVPELITTNSRLTGNCSITLTAAPPFLTPTTTSQGLSDCIHSMAEIKADEQIVPRNADGTWIFPIASNEFYQTNALYHLQLGANKFFEKLKYAYERVHSLPVSIPKSIPRYLNSSGMFWFKGLDDGQLFRNSFLTSYALCNKDKNAFFNPSGPILCFGYHSSFPGLYFIQDPSIIYHEFGHAMVSIMMNVRNATSTNSHLFRSNMGGYGYDEAGSVNEGLADYITFMMTGRTHMGEWALGKTYNMSRPLTEDDTQAGVKSHIAAVDSTSEGRLSYPQYLLYDSNHPNLPHEDVHYAGQTMTHFLVALTTNLSNSCIFPSLPSDPTDAGKYKHDKTTSYVMLVLAETLAEIGDLNARGIDNNSTGALNNSGLYFNNLDVNSSFLWIHTVNPITYRRFSQVFAKNIQRHISDATYGLCKQFTQDMSEKLLDDYGLLLFKTYNNVGKSTKDKTQTYAAAGVGVASPALKSVSENNRRKSVLISKQLLDLTVPDNATSKVSYFIIDGRTEMEGLLTDLLFKGFPVPLSNNVASVDYNNTNLKISPGEILAIIPNLFNNSNSTMAGVQLLATDWDHVDIDPATGNFKPCEIDTITTVDQGAQSGATCLSSAPYPDKNYTRMKKETSSFTTTAVAPVCMVQIENGTSTHWVSQNEFRKKQGLALQDKDCLGFASSDSISTVTDYTFNPHECLVRFLPGMNDAFYSKIAPQKSYYDSVVKISDDHQFNSGNLLIMEVNKWVPPGTKFRCRLRARFSNCSDCFSDPTDATNSEYLDYEYNGYKPFKVINFDFDVND